MSFEQSNDVLEAFIKIAPIIPMFFEEPISIAVTDKSKFAFYLPCKELPMKCNIGDLIPAESAAYAAMKSGNLMVKELPASVYGTPFKSYAVPLKDNNANVVGCIMLARTIETNKKVQQTIEDLSSKLNEVSREVDTVANGLKSSADSVCEIADSMADVIKQTEKMNDILTFIQKIAGSSKMMGLNASIEAARVGEAGKGFAIVAKEIEKMSVTTTDSANSISTTIHDIKSKVIEISKKGRDASDSFVDQTSALAEISDGIKNLNADIKYLEEFTKRL